MNICYIQIKVLNNTIYPLTITDISLCVKMKSDIKLPLVEDLKQINRNRSNDSFSDETLKDSNLSKYLMLQQDEEVNFLFKVDNPSIFNEAGSYILNINWLNLFDAKIKTFIQEFNNNYISFNEYYKLSLEEKPENNIIINQNFKITLKLESKNVNKKLNISLNP